MAQVQEQLAGLIEQVQSWQVWETIVLDIPLGIWVIVILQIVAAYLLARITTGLLALASRATTSEADDEIFAQVRFPLIAVITSIGIALAFNSLPLEGFTRLWFQRVMLALIGGMALWLVVRFYFGYIRRNRTPLRNTLITRVVSLIYWLGVVYTLGLQLITWPISCVPDCVSTSLTSTDLSGLDLTGINLTESNLGGSDLSGATLVNAILAGADLTNVNLQGANLTGADFVGSNLTGADLRGATVTNTDFRGAVMTGAIMTRMNLTGVILSGTILNEAIMVEAELRSANLSGTELQRVDLTGADLRNTILVGVRLSGSDLSGADLTNANLSGAFINLADLSNVTLDDSALLGTNLVGSTLTSTTFINSEMEGVVLVGANLSGADLSGANLSGARLFPSEFNPLLLVLDPVLGELNETQRGQVLRRVTLGGVNFDEETTWPPQKAVLLQARLGQEVDTIDLFTANREEDPVEEIVDNFQIDLLDVSDIRGNISVVSTSELSPLVEDLRNEFLREGFEGQISVAIDTEENAFQALCVLGTVDVVVVERRITESEAADCAANGHEVVPMRAGTVDTLVVIVNPLNTDIDDISVDLRELRELLTFDRWSDVSGLGSAASEDIQRFLPEPETDEFNFLVDAVFEGIDTQLVNTRNTVFEADDASVVWDLTDEEFGIAVIRYDYFRQIDSFIKGVPLLKIEPDDDGIEGDVYPLVRPLMMYTNSESLRTRFHVTAFLINSLENVSGFLPQYGYVPIRQRAIDLQEELLLLALGGTQSERTDQVAGE